MGISQAFYQSFKSKYPDKYYNFQDGMPVLKQGYSTSGAIGGSKKVYTIKGTKSRYGRWGGGKDSYRTIPGKAPINIYKLPGQQAAPKKKKAPAKPKPTGNYKAKNLKTKAKPVKFDTSAYDKQIAKLSKSLTGLQGQLKSNQANYAKSLKNQSTNFNKLLGNQQSTFDANMAAQTEKYDNNMASLRNSLSETMSNRQLPSVGVKTSGYTQERAALTRQGIKGTFGRSGLRIKGIKDKSLNI
jgi:hypothetical protein